MTSVEDFKDEVYGLAEKIGLIPKEIHLRKMKRKLASCSSKGRLTFSVELLKMPQDTRHRIIIHELLHLRYQNHGRMFRIMSRYYSGQKIIDSKISDK